MKITGLLLIFCLIGTLNLFAQDQQKDKVTGEDRKALRKAMKEEKKREKELSLLAYEEIAENRKWVIEAHTVFNKSGQSFPMDPTINFVSLNDKELVIQLSFTGLMGWNGVGGITVEGTTQQYVVKKVKNAINIQIRAMGTATGPVDLIGTIGPNGNSRITVSGNWGNKVTFSGEFVHLNNSTIYKGTTTY